MTASIPPWRRLPAGAEVNAALGVHFRVWAPRRQRVEVVLEAARGDGAVEVRAHPLEPEEHGYFSGLVADARAGTWYRYRLDGGDRFPDPASRFQPLGPDGPSQVIDPGAYRWSDGGWRGLRREGQVLYELHVGTFTPEGTFAAAAERLPALADVGITAVEVMPVADFPGRFGWGYDGVNHFAPSRLYGTPDDFRRFVDRAHAAGIGVLLDVVYNHLGPDRNYLGEFSEAYTSARHTTEWGPALNFDGPQCAPVRELFLGNGAYWIDEFHLDGLRLDATQSIFDDSPEHFMAELGERVRAAARGRGTLIVGENEPQQAGLLRPLAEGGCELDALWNDDFHHTAVVALTGRTEAYYTDYRGTPQELVSAAKYGFLYQGQPYAWQRAPRGSSTRGLDATRFVHFLENHDQVANTGTGARLHTLTSPARWRAMTALLLLGPQTPMLFQGQEFASSRPFHFFADHAPALATLVRKGRAEFVAQFPSLATPEMQARLADPRDRATFEACKLDWAERDRNAGVVALHRELLRLRRDDPVLAARGPRGLDGAVLGPAAFLLRFFGDREGDDRLLLVNLGTTVSLDPAPEPLLAPPAGATWHALFHSEHPRYGGSGLAPLLFSRRLLSQRPPQRGGDAPCADGEWPVGAPFWRIPGECAVLVAPSPRDTPHDDH